MNLPPTMFRDVITWRRTKLRPASGSTIGMPLWLGAKLQPEVDREDRLLDRDEGHRLEGGQDPEDAREVQRDVQCQEGALHDGGAVPRTDEPLHAQDVDAGAAQDHQREEQWGAPAIHRSSQAAPGDTRSVDRRRARRSVADVGITPDLVGMRVVRTVLGHPPAEAHSDQHVADGETQEPVGPAGTEHLLVARVVPHETELGEHQSEKRGDGEREPGVSQQDQPGEPGAERADRQWDLGAVVTEATVEQPGFSNLVGQDAEVLGRDFDGVRLHSPTSAKSRRRALPRTEATPRVDALISCSHCRSGSCRLSVGDRPHASGSSFCARPIRGADFIRWWVTHLMTGTGDA